MKLFVKTTIILLILAISNSIDHSVSPVTVRASPENDILDDSLLVIDKINIEAKTQNRFAPLEEFIPDVPLKKTAEEQNPLPQLLNKTSLRINASYSNVIGSSKSLVIHYFALDVYKVISGGNDELNRTSALTIYYDPNNPKKDIPELILGPNSSKSEAIILDRPDLDPPEVLTLKDFGIYKFVFRVQYHIYEGDVTPVDSFYHENITFEFVRSYPTPPYIIIYAFFIVFFIFIAWVVLGIYGDRKYRQIGQ